MPISDWFKAREDKRYTPTSGNGARSDVPEGVWTKCPSCSSTVYEGELARSLRVCPHCGHHMALGAHARISMLADSGSFEEFDAALASSDPLGFSAAKPYTESLETARSTSELNEAVALGRATIGGHPVVVGSMDFRFIGASMGSVVGEKIARGFELATEERRGVVLAVASGGARMQEGMLSLMQMAKTAAAAERHSEAGLPYISILTNPTLGGVTASFGSLADVILAEPGALIGFAGPRVIEQTIREKLPKEFQTAEYLMREGMIDEVVERGDLHEHIALLLRYLGVSAGDLS
jgi:acetyl-CoA carboxylase carboxyl transferase subunit beta